MKNILINLVKVYKKISAPFWYYNFPVSRCRFYPSCSDYAMDAISKYGTVKGALKSVNRVIRCNPFSQGGIDEA